MKKKLSLILCILSCILMMAGCSLTKTNENFDKKTLKTEAETFIASWFDYDFGVQLTERFQRPVTNTAVPILQSTSTAYFNLLYAHVRLLTS